MAVGLQTFKPYFTDDVFGTTILQNREHCDLSMAGHMFPQLLSISGHIKYKPANLPELHIQKPAYRNYLTTIQDNCGHLLSATAREKHRANSLSLERDTLLKPYFKVRREGKFAVANPFSKDYERPELI